MKKITLIFSCIIAANSLFAQKNKNSEKTVLIPCSEFHETRPLSEIFANNPVDYSILKKGESEDRDNRKAQKFRYSIKDGAQYGNDASTVQKTMGDVPTKAPIVNFAGQVATGFRPMDPSGAVGPNHYVQMINSTTFKIFNKTGGVLLTGTFGSLWTPATGNSGDPIVLYDKAADRWFMSQFGTNADKKIYIAISKTNDPTGAYYTYTYTSPAFPDYLKFSVWQDGYYMTSNQAQKVFCFERTAMIAGTPTARSLYTSFAPPQGTGFFVPLPGDAGDGTLPAIGTPCPIFSYSDNGWGAGFSDAVNIYQMAVNWVPTLPTATITLAANVATAAFDATYNASWNDCVQPGTTTKLDGIGGVCTFRAQWKTWSGYNTVVLNWGVQISTTQRSIKWCELRQNQSTGVWSMYQEGIYTPDASTRWLGSIAMDNNGSIALAYLKSDATSIYPSLCYAGRRTCDPLGTLPVTEVVAKAGSSSQTGVNRVGDYSQTVLDPDGVTFWHTGEYMSTGGAAATQIYSFQLAPCANAASVLIAQTAGTNPACPGSSVTFTATPTNGGTTPVYQWQVNGVNAGTNSPTFTSTTLATGSIITCIMTSNLVGVTGSPATSNAITMVISSLTPTISISGNNTVCAGASTTFTAITTNGGTLPVFQWQVNGVNAGTSNSSFTSSTYINGQIVTCILTSNAACLSTTTVTSNSITMVVKPIPATPTAGSNSPVCAGTVITLNTPTVATATYSWTGPNTFTSTAQNPSTAASTLVMGGTYSVTVTQTGCTSLAGTTTVVVNPAPATPTAGSNSPVCSGTTINLNTATVAGATYNWTGPNTFASTSQNPSTAVSTAAMAGTYSLTLTQAGCTSAAGTTTVVVSATPVAAFTATPLTTTCSGFVQFTDNSTGTLTSWLWNFGDGQTATTQNPSHTYTTSGNYTVTLTGTNGCGNNQIIKTNYITINVTSTPVGVDSARCGPGTLGLSATGSGVLHWFNAASGGTDLGTGTNFTTPSISTTTPYYVEGHIVYPSQYVGPLTTAAAGTYSNTAYTLTFDCLAASTLVSVAVDKQAAGTILINLTNTAGTVLQSGTYTVPAGASRITLNWPLTVGTGLKLVGPAGGMIWRLSTPGTFPYTLAGLVSITTCSSTTRFGSFYDWEIRKPDCVSPRTTVNAIINSVPTTPTISQVGLVLTSSSAIGNQWYLNGVIIPGATSQNYTIAANGNYTVIVTANGCSSVASTPVVMINVGLASVDNTYEFSIYPNPNDGNFNVSFTSTERSTYTLELINALGQLIYKDVLTDYTGTYSKKMNVTEYGKGVYTISLTNSKRETVKKIIVY